MVENLEPAGKLGGGTGGLRAAGAVAAAAAAGFCNVTEEVSASNHCMDKKLR